jgi:hypothetical protein
LAEEHGDADLMARSLEELRHILEWFSVHSEDGRTQRFVLIGGWAVYSYNPWSRSIDIDLVMNQRTKRGLVHHLRVDRGYVRTGPEHLAGRGLERVTPVGAIKLDTVSFESALHFEGLADKLELAFLKTEVVTRKVEDLSVPAPSRSMLLVMKLKAAWDRQWRVDNGTSPDPEWERTKALKDLADVLALVDPARGGTELDVDVIGVQLGDHPVLRTVLERIESEPLAAIRYGIAQGMATSMTGRLLTLTRDRF